MDRIQPRHRQIIGVLFSLGAAYFSVRWFLRYYVASRAPREPSNLVSVDHNESSSSKRRLLRNGPRVTYTDGSLASFKTALVHSNTAYSIRSCMSDTTTIGTQMFYDVEENLHFFVIYQDSLRMVESVPVPRGERTQQMFCESGEEFLAKVACLRTAFQDIIYDDDNRSYFVECGRDILKIFMSHDEHELEQCLEAYDRMLAFVSDKENHVIIEEEIATRSIPMLSFYDLCIDYIILESLDDSENPPAIVQNIVSNTWIAAGFRRSALQSAVSTALKYKRSQLKCPDGFFAHFYSVLDHLSPRLAWGFLGTDEDLKFKCTTFKESLLSLCRDYFSFDRVRYTSYTDISEDIMRVTRERYLDLTERLDILN